MKLQSIDKANLSSVIIILWWSWYFIMIVKENNHRNGITLHGESRQCQSTLNDVTWFALFSSVTDTHCANGVLMSDWPTGTFTIVFINVSEYRHVIFKRISRDWSAPPPPKYNNCNTSYYCVSHVNYFRFDLNVFRYRNNYCFERNKSLYSILYK